MQTQSFRAGRLLWASLAREFIKNENDAFTLAKINLKLFTKTHTFNDYLKPKPAN